MTKEWQEATNEYLKVRLPLCFHTRHSAAISYYSFLDFNADTVSQQKEKSNPLYGLTSEGYTGKGHVQSKSAKAQGIKIEPDD